MTDTKSTFRHKLYYAAIAGCWIHMTAAIFIPLGAYTGPILALGAAILAAMFAMLGATKRTLDVEAQFPDWFYKMATIAWGIGAIVWLMVEKA